MGIKIKKLLLKVFVSVFAVGAVFLPKSFWRNSSNLKEIESGSRKLFKGVENDLKIGIADADTITITGVCGSCGDSSGDCGDGGSGDGAN